VVLVYVIFRVRSPSLIKYYLGLAKLKESVLEIPIYMITTKSRMECRKLKMSHHLLNIESWKKNASGGYFPVLSLQIYREESDNKCILYDIIQGAPLFCIYHLIKKCNHRLGEGHLSQH